MEYITVSQILEKIEEITANQLRPAIVVNNRGAIAGFFAGDDPYSQVIFKVHSKACPYFVIENGVVTMHCKVDGRQCELSFPACMIQAVFGTSGGNIKADYMVRLDGNDAAILTRYLMIQGVKPVFTQIGVEVASNAQIPPPPEEAEPIPRPPVNGDSVVVDASSRFRNKK